MPKDKNTMFCYLQSTHILNYESDCIQELISDRKWKGLETSERIGEIYNFVRDEIRFGYSARDDLPASQVLSDGYGQCNTKGNLFMALLRATDTPCRMHGFTINKSLQKGALPLIAHFLAPRNILHSWVEVLYKENWINLEGFIIDKQYLHAVQQKYTQNGECFTGYGIATKCLSNPPIEWNCSDTYIQQEGINRDFGVYDDPDTFYAKQGTNLSGIKKLIFTLFVRHYANWHVSRIRESHRCSEDITQKTHPL